MIYGDLQFFDILIFAAIAGFIIYRLRGVLGKRTGFQKKNISEPKPQKTKKHKLMILSKMKLIIIKLFMFMVHLLGAIPCYSIMVLILI